MILYVNGDSHTAAAEAVNTYSFANDDIQYVVQGRRPHPDNLAVSWGMRLSKNLGLGLKCDAQTSASNDRIIRTTNEFIDRRGDLGYPYTVVVIGWSTWEREEWWDDETNEWVQITAAGVDSVPDKWRDRYRSYIANLDYYKKEAEAHAKIYEMHQKLKMHRIPHLFFNAMWHFSPNQNTKTDWRGCYLDPYNAEMSYSEWAVLNGHGKSRDQHFGPDAHSAWSGILANRLTPLLKIV